MSARHLENPQKLNPYAYALGNPLRFFDPDGMEEIEVFQPLNDLKNFGRGVWNATGGTLISLVANSPDAVEGLQIMATESGLAASLLAEGVSNAAANVVDTALTGSPSEVAGLIGGAAGTAAMALAPYAKAAPGGGGVTLDLFGGAHSQIPGAINVDIAAQSGVRASATALPFKTGSVSEIVASGPQASFLSEAARVLKPGGNIFINATKGNPFGKLPGAEVLQKLGLEVVQKSGELLSRFQNLVFRRTDGSIIPKESVKSTVLRKKPESY
jgi:hypothetical protein